MGNIDFSVTTEHKTVSFTSDFKEDGKPHKAGTPSLHQALTDSIARIAGAYNIAGALEREVAKLQPLFEAMAGAGVAGVNSEAAQRRTAPGPNAAKLVAEQFGFGAPEDGPKITVELNIDAGTSFVDESHPHAERLREFFGEQLAEAGATVPDDECPRAWSKDVERLMEAKDRRIADLNRKAELSEAEAAALRRAVESLQTDLKTRRQNVLDLAKQRDHLQHRNENQERSLKEMRAKLDLYEDGAPGVAELQRKYNELYQQMHDAAVKDTHLQDERDIARQERNRAIKDYNDLLAVHEDLKDQFTDQTERLNDSQRQCRIVAEECKALDSKMRAAMNERNREQEKVENYERRLGQVNTTVAAVIESIQADTSAHIHGGTSAPVSEMIHKSDALEAVKAITETIGKPFPPFAAEEAPE